MTDRCNLRSKSVGAVATCAVNKRHSVLNDLEGHASLMAAGLETIDVLISGRAWKRFIRRFEGILSHAVLVSSRIYEGED
jgi:hypothetical protein